MAETNATEITGDSVLTRIKSVLPASWTIQIQNDSLHLERKEPIYIIFTNHINEQVNNEHLTEEETKSRFEKHGRKERLRLSFRIELKWSSEKTMTTKQHNDSIAQEIEKLRDKYAIRELFKPGKIIMGKRSGDDHYEAVTKDDSLRLERFQKKESELKMLIKPIPDKCTEKYSLFSLATGSDELFPYSPEYTDVYPTSAIEEWRSVCASFKDQCNYKK